MEVVARRGFDATVDEIAKASGVSPRTIFRHYSTHDDLIVTTVKDMYEAAGRRPIEDLPTPDENLDGWIEGLALTIHTRNAEIVGDAFWDIHAPDTTPPRRYGIGRLPTGLPHSRGRTTSWVWRGRRPAARASHPRTWYSTFALQFSAFTTQALIVDFDQTPSEIGALTADILKMCLRHALEALERTVNRPSSPT